MVNKVKDNLILADQAREILAYVFLENHKLIFDERFLQNEQIKKRLRGFKANLKRFEIIEAELEINLKNIYKKIVYPAGIN